MTKEKGRSVNMPRSRPPQKEKSVPLSQTDSFSRRRLRKKRRKLRMVTFFIFLVVIAAFAVLSVTVFFHTDAIIIKGETGYTEEEILETSGLQIGKNLFLADRKNAKRCIEEQLPYVANAEIKISLPDTLKIILTPAKPEILLKTEKGSYLLDQNAKVLEEVTGREENYACFPVENLLVEEAVLGKRVVFSAEYADSILRNIYQALQKEGFSDVVSLSFSPALAPTLNYQNRIQIQLGAGLRFEDRISRAKELVEKYIEKDEKGVLDFSVNPDQPVFDPDYDNPNIIVTPGETAKKASSEENNGEN